MTGDHFSDKSGCGFVYSSFLIKQRMSVNFGVSRLGIRGSIPLYLPPPLVHSFFIKAARACKNIPLKENLKYSSKMAKLDKSLNNVFKVDKIICVNVDQTAISVIIPGMVRGDSLLEICNPRWKF